MLLVLAEVNMTPYPIAPMLRVDGPLLVTIMVGAPMEDRRAPKASATTQPNGPHTMPRKQRSSSRCRSQAAKASVTTPRNGKSIIANKHWRSSSNDSSMSRIQIFALHGWVSLWGILLGSLHAGKDALSLPI